MKLLLNRPVNYHVSADTVEEFEKCILDLPTVKPVLPFNKIVTKIAYYQWRLIKRLGINRNPLSLFKFYTSVNHKQLPDYFAILMAMDFFKCLPYFVLPLRKSIYVFDAWPVNHENLSQFVKYFGIEHVFLSSSQATDRLRNTIDMTQFHWIPEGINPEEYKHYSYDKKDIDVLSFGRKYNEYHEKIKTSLEKDKKVYLYSKSAKSDKLIFPTRIDFIDGLARSKVSICFPSSITNPEQAGDIQTMTIRYLQSIVSKCLIVGHAPEEMITIFGYNPVIEIDMKDPVSQLLEILNNFSDYNNLVEKNYNSVISGHTWSHRWQNINNILEGISKTPC